MQNLVSTFDPIPLGRRGFEMSNEIEIESKFLERQWSTYVVYCPYLHSSIHLSLRKWG